MNKTIFYTIFLVFVFTTPLQCMEEKSIGLIDTIPTIALHLNLRSVNALLCVNTAFYPGNLPDYLPENKRVFTQSDLQEIQLGLNRFLCKNPDFCKQLKPHDYTNALVHYAQTHNIFMFEYMINNESKENEQIRWQILKLVGHHVPLSINDHIFAYTGKSIASYTSEHLVKIGILNNSIKCSQILHAVAEYDHAALIPLALSRTKNVNVCNEKYETALWVAAQKGHRKTCRQLLRWGANPNEAKINPYNGGCHSYYGYTPLIWAVRNNDILLIKLLMKYGANINGAKNLVSPLHKAIEIKHYDLIPLLLEYGADISVRDYNNYCPLHIAAEMDTPIPYETLQLLINKDTLDVHNNDGYAPLHLTARKSLYLTNLLLIAGANIHNKDRRGNTPLHHAAQHGTVDILTSLVNHAIKNSNTIALYKAFVNAKNDNGKTALDVGFNRSEVCEYLQTINAETQYGTCIIS